jgi:hypothetical protein
MQWALGAVTQDMPALELRVELVTMGGRDGLALEDRQLMVIKEILAWLHQHPKVSGQSSHQDVT